MNFTNYHTHSKYCDGKGEIEDYVIKAINLGITSLGISSHTPLDITNDWSMNKKLFSSYISEITRLQSKYPQIEIYKGLELDYVPNCENNYTKFIKELDYSIGSVHYGGCYQKNGKKNYWTIDDSKEIFQSGLHHSYNNNLKKLIHEYYKNIIKMIFTIKPTIIGHIDLIKININDKELLNSQLSIVEEVLRVIKKEKIIVEINTGGIVRNKTDELYPSKEIIKRMLEKDIPITVNSDAHNSDFLIEGFDYAYSVLREIGYKKEIILKNNKWKYVNI